jgi:hypothetical protein
MKYALLIATAPEPSAWDDLSPAEQEAISAEYMAIAQEAHTLGGEHLQPIATATTVRVADGDTLTTDGPFAETKEELGGFYLIDVEDLDAAIAVAARVPAARLGGSVEVRPVVER